MIQDVKVPSVGESISEGVLAVWAVKDGDYVKKGQPLFELETDKASSEVPAPESGTVKHKAQEGDTVEIGAVVATIDTEGKASENGSSAKAGKESTEKREESAPEKEPAAVGATESKGASAKEKSAPPKAAPSSRSERLLATSVARKIAHELGVPIESVPGTGHGGRVTREDVEAYARQAAREAREKYGSDSAKRERTPRPTGGNNVLSWQGEVTRQRMSSLRKRIAERLVEAQHSAAMLTTFNDVDMTALMALRKEHKEAFEKKHGVGLGFMSFFTKAAVDALRAFPRVNAIIDENDIVTFHRQHVGIAVSTEKGLVVPVVRDAGSLSFAEIEKAIREFADKAREGRIELSDMQGGTFTITNGGVFGSMLSTPILNPPQSAILGMHRIEERPVARDGQVVVRPMMYLALSYDHRIIDGREAVGFLVRIKECIENPARMLLEV